MSTGSCMESDLLKFHFGSWPKMIAKNIHFKIRAHLSAPNCFLRFEYDLADITLGTYENNEWNGTLDPALESSGNLHWGDRPGAYAPSAPLSVPEILTDLTLTVRGQTLELMEFVRQYCDNVDDMVEAIDLCASTAVSNKCAPNSAQRDRRTTDGLPT